MITILSTVAATIILGAVAQRYLKYRDLKKSDDGANRIVTYIYNRVTTNGSIDLTLDGKKITLVQKK